MALDQVLTDLIERGFQGTQTEFQAALADAGFDVNQSTISRALKRLGARKEAGYWRLGPVARLAQVTNFDQHVVSIVRNEQLVVIKTIPGSANFVASYLDNHARKEVIGTIAGDDTVLVVPRSVQAMRACLQAVKQDLEYYEA